VLPAPLTSSQDNGRPLDSFARTVKKMLVFMIDKTTFVSQQPHQGAESDYPTWLENVRFFAFLCTALLHSPNQ
jgi:hypothetical protein